jgi:glycosyltransferase involved in cell wall biosynthesis
VVYAFILKKYHRLLYFKKIQSIYNYLVENQILKNIDIVHAHFLFSDGGVAYLIRKNNKIPFISAVRNTDVNVFWKYLFYLRPFGKIIMNSASSIVFLSPAYRKKFLSKNLSVFKRKSLYIPNGINENWFKPNINIIANKKIRLLYVGDFSKNKNVKILIEFINSLKKIMDCSLTLVGGGGNNEASIHSLLKKINDIDIRYVGRVSCESELQKIYQQHDILVLISRYETFGVVLIEALSQGLPIIYTKGQALDGYFVNSDFALACRHNSYEDFEKSVKILSTDIDDRKKNAFLAARKFKWSEISNEYLSLYSSKL